MNGWKEVQETLVAFGLVAAPALIGAIVLWRGGWERLRPLPHLKVGRWTGRTVIGHFLLYTFAGLMAFQLLDGLGLMHRYLPDDASDLRKSNLIGPLGNTLFMALSITLLHLGNRTSPNRVGLGLVRWRQNVFLGLSGFLLVTPVILSAYIAYRLHFPGDQHPLQRLASESLNPFEWVLLFLQAVVFGPLVEEWLFRGLVQGWLRRATLLGHAILICLTLGIVVMTSLPNPGAAQRAEKAPDKADKVPGNAYAQELFWLATALASVYGLGVICLYRPVLMRGLDTFRGGESPEVATASPRVDPLLFDLFQAEGVESREEPWKSFGPGWATWKHASARWAIVGSSMVFAAAHPVWPTPIPLFFLALALGWLTYRTQSLVPGIVVHALFNLVAFLVLFFEIHEVAIGNDDTIAARPAGSSAIVSVVPASWWPRLR